MAQVVTEWPLKNKPTTRLDQYLDGQIWRCTAGELELGSGEAARTSFRRRAKALGKRVKFLVERNESNPALDVVYVQAQEKQ